MSQPIIIFPTESKEEAKLSPQNASLEQSSVSFNSQSTISTDGISAMNNKTFVLEPEKLHQTRLLQMLIILNLFL
jgi:hypothetical protein